MIDSGDKYIPGELMNTILTDLESHNYQIGSRGIWNGGAISFSMALGGKEKLKGQGGRARQSSGYNTDRGFSVTIPFPGPILARLRFESLLLLH